MNDLVEGILKGSYDVHVHAGPDPGRERRMDALEVARHAYEAEMAGFVLKSNEYPSAPLAYAAGRMYPGLAVAGAIVLNRPVGGLNPEAVQIAANMGARVAWMPTTSADYYLRGQGKGPGITLTDDARKLRAEVYDILDIISERDMVLASGHVSPAEAVALFEAAKARKVQRMVASYLAAAASVDEQRQMASQGVYLEYAFASCMPSCAQLTLEGLAAAISTFGVDHCIVSTGCNQWMDPPPAEGMRMAIAGLLHAGMKPYQVSTLVKANPLQLVGVASA